jgi:hypothetical protein
MTETSSTRCVLAERLEEWVHSHSKSTLKKPVIWRACDIDVTVDHAEDALERTGRPRQAKERLASVIDVHEAVTVSRARRDPVVNPPDTFERGTGHWTSWRG